MDRRMSGGESAEKMKKKCAWLTGCQRRSIARSKIRTVAPT